MKINQKYQTNKISKQSQKQGSKNLSLKYQLAKSRQKIENLSYKLLNKNPSYRVSQTSKQSKLKTPTSQQKLLSLFNPNYPTSQHFKTSDHRLTQDSSSHSVGPGSLTQKQLRSKSYKQTKLRLPIYIPQSEYKKANNFHPQMITKQTRTGQIFPLYIVGDPPPIHDPLIKSETFLTKTLQNNKSGLKEKPYSTRTLVHTQKQELSQPNWKFRQREVYTPIDEESPVKVWSERASPARSFERIGNISSMARGFTFREQPRVKATPEPKRKWVVQRMQSYINQRVNRDFIPKISEAKRAEIDIRSLIPAKHRKIYRLRIEELLN